METYNEVKTAIQEMGKTVSAAKICEIIWNGGFTISEKLELIEALTSKIETNTNLLNPQQMKTLIQNITKKQAVIETSLLTFTITALIVIFHFFNNF